MKKIGIVSIIFTIGLIICPLFAQGKALYVTTKSGLTMREKPRVDGMAIMVIPCKARVTVVQKKISPADMVKVNGRLGNWIQISYNEKTGYAFDGYLSDVEPSEKNPLVGHYIMDIDPSTGSPSNIYLYENKTCTYTFNRCSGFQNLYGKYEKKGGMVHVTIVSGESAVDDMQKGVLHFKIEGNDLRLVKVVPAGFRGCDYNLNVLYFKK